MLLETRVSNIRFTSLALLLMSTDDSDNPLKEFGIEIEEMLTEPDEHAEVSGVSENEFMPGEVKGAEAGVLTASGLTECVGIAVYDQSSETGYMGHIVTNANEDIAGDIQTFNTLMIMNDVDFENSHIYFAGLDKAVDISDHFLGDKGELEAVENEGKMRRLFEKYGESYFGESETAWGYEGEDGGQLILDANEGEIMYNPEWSEGYDISDPDIEPYAPHLEG